MIKTDKAVKLMTCKDLKPVSKYIYEAFEKRKIMLDSLSTLNDIMDNIDKQETASAKIEAAVKHTISSMITKIENTRKSSKIDKKSYIIKDASNDGLKFTIVWKNT